MPAGTDGPSPDAPATALVVGASGGLGRALVAALATSGRFAAIHALSRTAIVADAACVRPGRIDLTDEASIVAATRAMADGPPVTLAIVATGLLHADGVSPEKALSALDPDALRQLFAVNAIGPALVAKHVLPLFPRRGRAVFAALSARVGSIGDNRLGGWYGYRASKAALNQILRTLAIEVARTRPDAFAVGLHPGTVATALSRPFRPDPDAAGLLTPAESAARLIGVIDGLQPGGSGLVYDHSGLVIPP